MVSGAFHSYNHRRPIFRDILFGFLITICGVTASLADTPGDAFRQVIEGQIEALSRDDGVTAFGFASPDIQKTFRTPEQFMRMVRSSFKPVYRPRSYSFEAPILVEGHHTQPVRFIGPDGRGVVALYKMERQDDGSWRIGGVTLHPTGERGI